MIIYEQLNTAVELGKVAAIMAQHDAELYPEDGNPDLQAFTSIVNAGMARIYVVKDGTKVLGYALFVLSRDFFRAHIVQAECLSVYIKPEHRGVHFKKLMQFAEMSLKREQVNRLLVNAVTSQKNLEKLYARYGFKTLTTMMSKEL